jgi:plastocyanin
MNTLEENIDLQHLFNEILSKKAFCSYFVPEFANCVRRSLYNMAKTKRRNQRRWIKNPFVKRNVNLKGDGSLMRNKNHLCRISLPMILFTAIILQTCTAADMGMPSIIIMSPSDGSSVTAGNITVGVNVSNFNLVDKLGKANVAGEGHIHYYMDATIPTVPGKPALSAPGKFVPTINKSFTWYNVASGMHNFSVQLVNNDHTPLIPLVTDQINVNVVADQTMRTMGTENVTIDLIAENMAFNTSKITVPAGSSVTINFDNRDPNIPHNFAAYTDNSANKAIFIGEIITGPSKIAYTFTAPTAPGSYFFRCDIHPSQMTGDLVVI